VPIRNRRQLNTQQRNGRLGIGGRSQISFLAERRPKRINAVYLAHKTSKLNADKQRDAENEARRKKLLQLGRLLQQCGERPTAEFFAECVNLPPDVRDELIRRLEDFTRLGPELYKATGADRFVPHLIGLDVGRKTDFWYPLLEKMSAADCKTTIAEAFRYGVIGERDAEIFNTSWPYQEGA